MIKKLRIVVAQLNLTVGDIQGNLKKHIQAATSARNELTADIIIFPELSLTGYPPQDLLLRPEFLTQAQEALQTFIQTVKDIYCFVGHPYKTPQGLYNTCSVIYNGAILGRYSKQHLPNYGVFDEQRYFVPGDSPCVLSIKGISVGVVICEDLWVTTPVQKAAALGARIILSPNASPFEIDKHDRRVETLAKRAQQNDVAIFYANCIGGQDELIFDGGSLVIDEQGHVCQLANFFTETLMPVDIEVHVTKTTIRTSSFDHISKEAKVYQALVLSVRDYIEKNSFPGIYVGVSGGIDSALTLAIAVDAIGKDRVQAIVMPSHFTTTVSLEEAEAIIHNLGVESKTISIEPIYLSSLATLASSFGDQEADTTEQNIQARCRAIILMALSNKFGYMVLTTGNRSEIAVGYCTLYGDMAGGFAVLKDVPKTLVYALAKYRNNISPVIPKRTIERAPTAELALDQKDEDSLPPYAILDPILHAYLNEAQSKEEIIKQGYDANVVAKIISLVHKAEYKRAQAAIGPHINHKSFGKDWRYPITNGFKG